MKNIELKQLVGGALQEQFTKSFEKVLENLQNPNTPFKNSREINIKLKFTQNEMRDDVKCSVSVSEKLAPQSTMETNFAIGKDLKTGKLYAEEYGKYISNGQMSIDDLPMNDTQVVEGNVVDTETGEIINQADTDNVIDLRAVASN
jgi:hypothetical protein